MLLIRVFRNAEPVEKVFCPPIHSICENQNISFVSQIYIAWGYNHQVNRRESQLILDISRNLHDLHAS